MRQEPVRAITLTLLLEILAEHCGGDLLRLKGIVNVAESPERPVFGRPAIEPGGRMGDMLDPVDHRRRSRLVFIGRGIPQAWVAALLDALEVEVGEVTRGPSPAA